MTNKLEGDSTTGESSKVGPGQKRFKIALSFPGEHRAFVEQVAVNLAAKMEREDVLYGKYYEAEFARPDLDTYLQALYHQQSELIAVFLCADYEGKDWCGLEWRAIRDLIKQREASAVMPFRFDSTEIPGLFSIDGYIWIDERTPQEIADLILQRFQSNSGDVVKPYENPQPTERNGNSNATTDTGNTPDPARLEKHLEFQNRIRAKIEEELAKDTLTHLREGFTEVLWKNAGKTSHPEVPELVNELFCIDKTTGCADPESDAANTFTWNRSLSGTA